MTPERNNAKPPMQTNITKLPTDMTIILESNNGWVECLTFVVIFTEELWFAQHPWLYLFFWRMQEWRYIFITTIITTKRKVGFIIHVVQVVLHVKVFLVLHLAVTLMLETQDHAPNNT